MVFFVCFWVAFYERALEKKNQGKCGVWQRVWDYLRRATK